MTQVPLMGCCTPLMVVVAGPLMGHGDDRPMVLSALLLLSSNGLQSLSESFPALFEVRR